ncbi:MAG TPA: hypothetical protein PKD64_04995 [Pirellulaceae bacterium]|nr:hypothetical protein [Pirellulaceae bacterium]HMO91532.1 hypothetical protein [Pirellulaceae bacterium]HMP68229.1 hypothetical protein [Pirellulaceae bacterium]
MMTNWFSFSVIGVVGLVVVLNSLPARSLVSGAKKCSSEMCSNFDDERFAQLEERVDRLENLLFNATKLAVFDAERRLSEAHDRLTKSERLFLQGFITEAQISQDRFAADRAFRELELAKASCDGRLVAGHIDLMQAKRNLELALQQLEFSERMRLRGFVTSDQLEIQRRLVESMRLELQHAQTKLEAVNELHNLRNDDKDATSPPETLDKSTDKSDDNER